MCREPRHGLLKIFEPNCVVTKYCGFKEIDWFYINVYTCKLIYKFQNIYNMW